MELDFLAFAAHPDDAELSMGGTIIKMIDASKTFGICDLTRGELGTRGTIETRKIEAENASKILGIQVRENLSFVDGQIENSDHNVKSIISIIRKYKPKIIFAPYFNDRHPDHIDVSKLVKRAHFLSGLPKVETSLSGEKQKSFRPDKIFYYAQTYEFTPSFIIDISESFEQKMKAVRAYSTQFHNKEKNSTEPQTFISTPEFIEFLEARAKYYGFKIGKKYGEPFFTEEHVELDLANYFGNLK